MLTPGLGGGSARLALMLSFTLACVQPGDDPAHALRDAEVPRELAELDPDSPSLDAVGVLGVLVPGVRSVSPTIAAVCTGTLIGPSSLVTSQACSQALARRDVQDLANPASAVFGIGPDPAEPVAWAHVVDVADVPDTQPVDAPVEVMGLAVLHLEKPLLAVPKAKLANVSAALVGEVFVQVGYAAPAAKGAGQRKVVPVQLTEVRERTLEATAANGCEDSRAFSCAGAALLRVDEAGELVLYGVTSDVSDQRSVYTSFVDWKLKAFLEEARAWTDPCGSLAQQPECAGEVTRRCSRPDEGGRRIVEQDCTEHGMACLQSEGGVSCAPQHL
mgnify:FL=1